MSFAFAACSSDAELLLPQMGRMRSEVARALNGLSAEQLRWRPHAGANSIAFLVWHALRAWDEYHFYMGAGEQLYEPQGWPQRLGFDVGGRGTDGSGMGTGFTAEDVALVQPQAGALEEYLDALWGRAQEHLSTASDETLTREVRIPWWSSPTTQAGVLTHVMFHTLKHLGEAQYARELLPR
ncbi:MAG: DinB family protein [Chloroflexi bacterium]|nr:DinB family protein [Chloroflexota bacterium]MBI3733974.1 DinB family protein [Chloroflexota bacterium]